MANIKSAKKRVLTTEVRTARNKAIKSKVKTYVKNVESAIAAGDKAAAQAALTEAIGVIPRLLLRVSTTRIQQPEKFLV